MSGHVDSAQGRVALVFPVLFLCKARKRALRYRVREVSGKEPAAFFDRVAEVAREMVDEVRALATVRGLRGKPKGDLEALAAAVSALSQLAVRPEFGISEAEVNPMLVMPEGQGVMAVDALVLK